LVRQPESWLKWALYDRRPLANWSQGAATLLGDAAHPMLPFMAQGAAMAIEDAAVVAQCLAHMPDDPARALKTYVAMRRARTHKMQRLAARNGKRYHLGGMTAMLRNVAMRVMGGEHLLHHYDWIYQWRPPAASPNT
jgi:salicylate hydroxylase